MTKFRAMALLILVVAGCGDNVVPASNSHHAAGGFSSVGGSQVAHSKSFTLVTRVATSPQPVSKNRTVTLKPGFGEQ